MTLLRSIGLRPASVGAAFLLSGAAAVAQTEVPVTLTTVAEAGVSLERGRLAAMQPGRLVRFDLADGAFVTGVVAERRDRAAGRFSIFGRLSGRPAGSFLLAVNREAMAGYLRTADTGFLRVRTRPGGRGVLEQFDPALTCEVDDGAPRALAAEPPSQLAGPPCDDGSVIDVLILYTQGAVNEMGSAAAVEAEIDVMVDFNSVSYSNSLIATGWNIVYVRRLPPGVNPDLGELADPDDGVADGIHTLRDAYGADEVALVVDGGGGVAMGLWNLDPASQGNAFCVNGLGSSPLVLSHEIGHNLGCCHGLGDGGGCPREGGLLFPYSNGHRFTGGSGELWHTVMAYSPGITIEHFSNPNVSFDGEPTGIAEGEPGAADNVATINLAAFTVSNWRCNDGVCEALGLPADADDCTGNGVPDLCDIALGTTADINDNGIADVCECVGDLDGNHAADVVDLLILLAAWGTPAGDLNGDGNTDVQDLLIILAAWGACS